MNLYDELLALVDVLEQNQLEYALCGGLAVGILGHPRMTKDIDLLVRAEDVSSANMVPSSRIADAVISYKGKKIAPRSGILGKILSILWP